MKYFRSFILVLSFSLFMNAQLQASPALDDSNVLKQKIINKMSFPDGAEQGVVHAIFSVKKNGEIAVYDVESHDPKLAEYVLNKLRSISIKGDWDSNQIFNLNFVFKKES